MQLAESKKNFSAQYELEAEYDDEEDYSDESAMDDDEWLQDLFYKELWDDLSK